MYPDKLSRPVVTAVAPESVDNGADGTGGFTSRFSSVKVFHKMCRTCGGWPSVTVIHADEIALPDAPGFVSGCVRAASSSC